MAKQLVLIAGVPASGKSASLMYLKNPERVFYLGTEAGKNLPFPSKFKTLKSGLNNPLDIFPLFKQVEENKDIDTVIIDSLTFLMELFESKVVLTSQNTMKGWSDYQQFFKSLMQDIIGQSQKNWILIAHNNSELTNTGDYKYYVPVKGSLKNVGIEAYFSIIVYSRRVKIDELKALEYDPEYLHITSRDEAVGYKHIFQCEPTKELADSRIRSPLGCFNEKQVFIDNNCQLLLDHLNKYYGLDK